MLKKAMYPFLKGTLLNFVSKNVIPIYTVIKNKELYNTLSYLTYETSFSYAIILALYII
jgi:hypothetical protein